jgi:hypothetical protein
MRDHILGSAFLAEACQYQKRSCQPLFARIEQLIDQIRLRAVVTVNHVCNKKIRKLMFSVERAQQLALFDPQDTAVRNCGGAYRAKGLIVGAPETSQDLHTIVRYRTHEKPVFLDH